MCEKNGPKPPTLSPLKFKLESTYSTSNHLFFIFKLIITSSYSFSNSIKFPEGNLIENSKYSGFFW